jgi:putative inorganic carbon (HCO3(-)) transporter
MDHADTAHLAAVFGALGAALVFVARTRLVLLAGFATLAVAEVGLAYALTGGPGLDAGLAVPAMGLAAAGALFLGTIAAGFVRYPALVLPLVLAAAPFRLPLDVDRRHEYFVAVAESGELGRLLPLYVVLSSAGLALVFTLLRGAPVRPLPPVLAFPAAAFFAFACVSLLWTTDLVRGANLLAFFLLPFAALVAILGQAPFPDWMPRALAAIAVALGCLFAAVGLWQAATERLLFFAPNLEVANIYGSFFRVTSLFRDPSLYGRHLVLAIAVVLVALFLRKLHWAAAGALVALLWSGLYFSYSQSSMLALVAVTLGIAAVAGDRSLRIVAAAAAAVAVIAVGAVLAIDLRDESARRVTGDRSRRVDLTAQVVRDRPLVGVGLGAQPGESRERSARFGPVSNFVSHTTPLTVAAELGAIGLALYLALLAGTVKVLYEVRLREPALGLALAAAIVALFVHALLYSGFFEDPITWVALGIAASCLAVRAPARERARAPAARRELVRAR